MKLRKPLFAHIHNVTPRFTRVGYAVSLQDHMGVVLHVETFFGHDGRKLRAEAIRFGKRAAETGDIGPQWPSPAFPHNVNLTGKIIR